MSYQYELPLGKNSAGRVVGDLLVVLRRQGKGETLSWCRAEGSGRRLEPSTPTQPVLGCASQGTLAPGSSSRPAVWDVGAGWCVLGHVWKMKGLIPLLIMKLS